MPFLTNSSPITWIKWNPTNQEFAVAYAENANVTIFDASSSQVLNKLTKPKPVGIDESVSQLSWSPNGRLLAIGFHDDAIFVWDLTVSPPRIISTVKQSGPVIPIYWSPDSQQLAFSSGNDTPTVSIWNLASNKVSKTLPQEIRAVQWSPDGKEIAVLKGGQDGEVLDSKMEKNIFHLPLSPKDGFFLNHIVVDWSPDSQHIMGVDCNATTSECVVWFRDLPKSELILGSNSESTTVGVTELTWRPAGDLVASNSGRGLLNIWDANSGRLLATIESDGERFISLGWSPDGQMLIAATEGGTPHVWKIENLSTF